MTELQKLVAEFARHVQAQTEAIWRGDAKTGNKHADQCFAVFDKLRAHGDAGRDALAVLFTHSRMDVRVSAAALLLRHRTAEAKAVLEEAAKGQGLVPFEASQALKRWDDGTWALDPADKEWNMVAEFEMLVEAFAYHVQAQTQEIFGGDTKTGNKHAKKAVDAFLKLRAHGDAGRDAFAVLLTHPSMDVRTAAAAFLLRHRTAEAKAVLEEAAKGQGLIPFGASEALKRREEGTWELDPAEDDVGQSEAPRPAPPNKRSRPHTERAAADRRRGIKRDKPGS